MPSAANMMRRYESRQVSVRSSQAREASAAEDERNADDPFCLCVRSSFVIVLFSFFTFVLSIAMLIVGIYVNNEAEGWDAHAQAAARNATTNGTATNGAAPDLVRQVRILGYLCIGLGVALFLGSFVGVAFGRTKSRPFAFVYLVVQLFTLAAQLLAMVYALVEATRIGEYIVANWAAIQALIGLHSGVTAAILSQLMRSWLFGVAAASAVVVVVLVVPLACVFRMIGLRQASARSLFSTLPPPAERPPRRGTRPPPRPAPLAQVTLCFLITLGVMGVAEAWVAFVTRRTPEAPHGLPTLITGLLLGCAGIQISCSVASLCGFKRLSKECVKGSGTVLLVGIGLTTYVVVASYKWLREPMERPEHVMVVLAIALVADFFMCAAAAFQSVYYCRAKAQFREADRRNLGEVHFSDYATRQRNAGRRSGPPRGRRTPREFMPRNAL